MMEDPTLAKRESRPIALSCANLWKVYRASRAEFARNDGAGLSDEALAERGWVAAMRDVSLDIAKGEVFVIMGLSGSGKSTLIRCLTRLVEPTAGSVNLDGVDLLGADDAALIDIRRKRMGMVFQHFALLPHRNVLGNIAFPLQAQGMPRRDREERAREIAALVGLDGWEERYPSELSGGQQQRVGIARSLATNPDLWFLDEPFSALDPLIRADLQDELLRLQSTLSKTVVFITHDLDEAIRIADRIAIMENGRIVQIGTPEDLVLQPADDYVERFVAKVPLAKVVHAGRLMSPLGGESGAAVHVDATIAEIAPLIVTSDIDLTIIDQKGAAIGRLQRERALEVLADIRPEERMRSSSSGKQAKL